MVSATTQLKFLAPDGKKRLSEMLDYEGIIALGKEFPGKRQTSLLSGLLIVMKALTEKVKQRLTLFLIVYLYTVLK